MCTKTQSLASLSHLRLERPVYVTRSRVPPTTPLNATLEQIWGSRWFTNLGEFHEELEARLASYLAVQRIRLVSSGTMALSLALKGLQLGDGEVITTPFTFPATAHAIRWAGLTPVFADIDPETLCLDPEAVVKALTHRTRAILPVHLFGRPADLEAFAAIGRELALKVLYDGAHAFGVQVGGRSICSWGDATALSFHATKLFSTVEGGAVVSTTDDLDQKIALMRNFGIVDEETVPSIGVNGKLSEVHAAFGLHHLPGVHEEIQARGRIAELYRHRLAPLKGIVLPPAPQGFTANHSYFPIRVESHSFGMHRDRLHRLLEGCNVRTRKYFSPLLSQQPPYAGTGSCRGDLPAATRVGEEILCLPIYGELETHVASRICDIIQAAQDLAR